MAGAMILPYFFVVFLNAGFHLFPLICQEDHAVQGDFLLSAEDKSNGAGGEITLSIMQAPSPLDLEKIVIERSLSPEGEFEAVGSIAPTEGRFVDRLNIEDGLSYFYRAVGFFLDGSRRASSIIGPAVSHGSWFKEGALFTCSLSILVLGALLFFLFRAGRGFAMYIRPIPGLKAVEEAIGRATEMGRPILYCSGVAPLSCPGVMASFTVLGWVGERVAEYGATLTYPVNNALNLTAGQEILKESYLQAGKPELYNDDMVYFISGEQFAYAAAVCGVMERERTAANLFFGSFWSESLVLTESGAATGAIQIAATDSEHQIPFMVATCDYVIIGEELFAASAYLSDQPSIKSGLKAQDFIKAVMLALILMGVVFSTMASVFDMNFDWFFGFFRR